MFPEAVCHRSPGACSGLSLSFASLWKGAWEGNACRKSAGTVRDGCLYFERGAEGCEDCLSPVLPGFR